MDIHFERLACLQRPPGGLGTIFNLVAPMFGHWRPSTYQKVFFTEMALKHSQELDFVNSKLTPL